MTWTWSLQVGVNHWLHWHRNRVVRFLLFIRSDYGRSFATVSVKASVLKGAIEVPNLLSLIVDFLSVQTLAQISPPYDPICSVYPSASVTFRPRNASRIAATQITTMRQIIRSVGKWRQVKESSSTERPEDGAQKDGFRNDTVFLKTNVDQSPGLNGYGIARIRTFFSFRYYAIRYDCALIDDYELVGNTADEDTGMWKVRVKRDPRSRRTIRRVIPLTDIFRAAHLIPVFKGTSDARLKGVSLETSLDDYQVFYVNAFIDYHAFQILSPSC
jgi:hypothetical protein